MDREEEIWFIHDYDLYVESEEEYEKYLELLNWMLVYGNPPPVILEEGEEWEISIEASTDQKYFDSSAKD